MPALAQRSVSNPRAAPLSRSCSSTSRDTSVEIKSFNCARPLSSNRSPGRRECSISHFVKAEYCLVFSGRTESVRCPNLAQSSKTACVSLDIANVTLYSPVPADESARANGKTVPLPACRSLLPCTVNVQRESTMSSIRRTGVGRTCWASTSKTFSKFVTCW